MAEALAAPVESPWLTVREAAARAKVGKAAIYAAVQGGKLKATRVGVVLRIHVEWLDAWLEAQATVVNPEAPGREIPFAPRRLTNPSGSD